MEQQQPRSEYIAYYDKFLKLVKYDDKFVKELQNHSNREYLKVFMNIDIKDKEDREMMRKGLIFLEFTRERSTCNQMIKILNKCGQTEAAEKLKKFNTSPDFWQFMDEIELQVTNSTFKRSVNSMYYELEGKPKGHCIIINNIKADLEKESLRFEHIFKTLGFYVELWYDLTAQQIEERLKYRSEVLTDHDHSLIITTISHGEDEKIICVDDSELSIVEIVDYFNVKNCPQMKLNPKLFFFNCCRLNGENGSTSTTRSIHKMKSLDDKWINENKSTLICYACAQGTESWYTPQHYTQFGQALSHCIAQYACDKTLLSILNLTCDRMPPECAPEMRSFKMTKDLYLNPGF